MELNGQKLNEWELASLTEEELRATLPDGNYTIISPPPSVGERGFHISTGKGGAINYILSLKKLIDKADET